jgi:hypothetical protein
MLRCIGGRFKHYLSCIWMPATNLEAIEWYERQSGIAVKYLQTEAGHRLFLSRLPYVQQFHP